MQLASKTSPELIHELEELRTRLAESEECLRAIRTGEVDALVAPGAGGEQLFLLRGSEFAYRALVERMNQGAATLSEEGVLLYCNQRCAELLDAPAGQLIGSPFRDFVASEDQAALAALLASAGSQDVRGEISLQTGGGLPCAAELALNLMPPGTEARFGLVITDLRGHKQNERRAAARADTLTKSNEDLRVAALNIMRDAVDAAARLASANKELRDQIAERERAEGEVRQLNAQLELRVRERTSALEAANKELEAFSYTVSHDLRAPLRAMDGFSKILLLQHAAGLSAEAKECLNLIRGNAQQMGRLIDDLLHFSRVGRASLDRRLVSAGALVRDCLDLLRPETEGRQVEMKVLDLPECLADRNLLKLVWLNLLSNALKYTRRRPVARIEIGSQPGPPPVFFVRDNGVGFDMKYVGKLFGVFHRLHRAEDYEGTGVGLATAQRIVQRHGGRIWATGSPNLGAVFSFTLEPGALPPKAVKLIESAAHQPANIPSMP